MSSDYSLPLDGLRVLDASRVLAGPFATMLLADLGADVVKLEPPDGDESRTWGPPFWGDPAERMSAYFSAVNRNKRSIVIDLGTDTGRDLLDRLADRADLLIHNARPSSARRLGLDASRLTVRHPDLVVASIGGFAGGEAAAERPAYDLLAQAISGLMSVTGEPAGEPMKVGVALLDLLAGLELAIGALATLLGRQRRPSTTDPTVEVALVEVGVTSLVNVLANLLADGVEPARHGNAHPNIVPYQVFAAADGHLAIAVGNDAQFDRLWTVLGLDPDARFVTNPGRVRHRSEVVAKLADVIAGRQREELVAQLEAAGVPAGPVNRVGEALAAMEAAHPEGWLQGTNVLRLAPDPIRVGGQRLPLRLRPPRLGEHTDAILRETGLDAEEIARLRAAGTVR
jgi:crotonobetainyl-CoA:carnitine CoA-transferase CaiB-like acyl-CoA transferase